MTKISRQNFVNNMVFTTGLTRSGKTMIAPIVSSLKRVDHLTYNYTLEQIPMFEILKLMPKETAKCLMRFSMDEMYCDLSVGRYMNLRFGDLTSVWKSDQPLQYLKRMFTQEGDESLESIHRGSPYFHMQVHDAVWHADLYFDAFPEAKMIHLTRHPVSMVHEWYTKSFGGSVWESPRNAILTIDHKGATLPYYAAGWEEEYVQMSEADRCIYMVKHVEDSHRVAFEQMSQSWLNQILTIPFEKTVVDIDKYLDQICVFLNTERTSKTSAICKRERVPRKIYKANLDKEFHEIKAGASEKAIRDLEEMSQSYEEKHFKGLVFEDAGVLT